MEKCSFCEKEERAVKHMVVSPTGNKVVICDECIKLCQELVDKKMEEQNQESKTEVGDKKTRPGREWEMDNIVSPRAFALDGYCVKGRIVKVVPISGLYSPPIFYEEEGEHIYETQENVYIVEWSAKVESGFLEHGHGAFFGNDLLSIDDAVGIATRVIQQATYSLAMAQEKKLRNLHNLE